MGAYGCSVDRRSTSDSSAARPCAAGSVVIRFGMAKNDAPKHVLEFGEAYAVPSPIDDLVRLGYIKDLSHHNDACPSFGVWRDGSNKHSGEDREVRLWVEHPDPAQRETDGGDGFGRFNVTHPGNQYLAPVTTDDLGVALIWLDLALRQYGFRGLPRGSVGTSHDASVIATGNYRITR